MKNTPGTVGAVVDAASQIAFTIFLWQQVLWYNR
jgi:hypothetical protein